MNKKVLSAALVTATICLTGCNQQANTTEQTTADTTASQATMETTVSTTPTTAVNVPDEAKKFAAAFTEFTSDTKGSLIITLEGDTYTAKLNIANTAAGIPKGEYTATYKYSDLKEDNGIYRVNTHALGAADSYSFEIAYYGEEGIDGISATINGKAVEYMKGTPVM